MIRRVFSLAILAASLALGQAVTSRQTYAADPVVSVTPGAGPQDQTFVFVGSGFAPGSTVQATFTSPDGVEVTFYFTGTQTPYFVTTADDGTWTFNLTPVQDLEGHQAGTWTVKLCVSEGSGCYSGTFDISL